MNEDSEAQKENGRDSRTKMNKGGGSLPRRTESPKSGIEGVSSNRDAGLIAGESLEQVGESSGTVTAQPASAHPVRESTGKSAFLVGAGILISRIVGLIRQRIFAYYFGTSGAGDAFSAAFRIPNFLQNVFGEGALSASFIPVYAKLLAQGDEKEAQHVAKAVLGLLALITSIIVLLGVLTTPYLISI